MLALLGALLLGGAAAPTVAGAQQARLTPIVHLNVCDAARHCTTGQAATRIPQLLRAERPELVTLNEVCSSTVARVARETGYHPIFTRAGRASCPKRRGAYGNAILAAPQRTLTPVLVHKYSMQQAGPEKRMLTCADSSQALVCVTHLDHLGKAPAQAREMRGILKSQLKGGHPLAFVGADLNLAPRAAAANALPKAMLRYGDGRVMHVFYSRAFGMLDGSKLEGVLDWSDHVGLRLQTPAPAA